MIDKSIKYECENCNICLYVGLLLLKGDDENYNVNNNNNRINDNSNKKNDGIHLNSFKDTRLIEDQMQGGIKQMNSISSNSKTSKLSDKVVTDSMVSGSQDTKNDEEVSMYLNIQFAKWKHQLMKHYKSILKIVL